MFSGFSIITSAILAVDGVCLGWRRVNSGWCLVGWLMGCLKIEAGMPRLVCALLYRHVPAAKSGKQSLKNFLEVGKRV